jgi:hypothetical protein
MTGGQYLEVRGENAVMVGWGLALSFNDFYDNQVTDTCRCPHCFLLPTGWYDAGQPGRREAVNRIGFQVLTVFFA